MHGRATKSQPSESRSRHWPGIAVAASTATVTVMPGFTVGTLAPWIESDLHVSSSMVGLAMSAFYAATALGSPVTKRLAGHLPVPVVLAVAARLPCHRQGPQRPGSPHQYRLHVVRLRSRPRFEQPRLSR